MSTNHTVIAHRSDSVTKYVFHASRDRVKHIGIDKTVRNLVTQDGVLRVEVVENNPNNFTVPAEKRTYTRAVYYPDGTAIEYFSNDGGNGFLGRMRDVRIDHT